MKFPLRIAALGALVVGTQPGCETAPSPDQVCYDYDGQSAIQACVNDPVKCFGAVLDVKVQNVVPQSSDTFSCQECTGIPPDLLSTDTDPQAIWVHFGTADLTINMNFAVDTRATVNPTTELLQQYANHPSVVWHHIELGRSAYSELQNLDWQILNYDPSTSMLHVSFEGDIAEITYKDVPIGCGYYPEPGSEPVHVVGDLQAPMVWGPYMPPPSP